MGIQSFYRKTVTIQRLTNVGGGSLRQDWQDVAEDVACAIHPVSPEDVTAMGAAFFQSHKMFCAASVDIEIGDRVVDGSVIYTVKGKSLYDDMGGANNEHARISLVKGK